MKIRVKLMLGFLTLTLFMGIAGYVGINITNAFGEEFDKVALETVPIIEALDDLKLGGLRIVSSTSEFGFISAEKIAGGIVGEAGGDKGEEKLIKEGQELYKESLKRYKILFNKHAKNENKFLDGIEIAGRELQEASAVIIELKKQGVSGAEVLEAKEIFEEKETAFLAVVDTALANEDKELANRNKQVKARINKNITIIVLWGVVVLILSIVSGLVISYSIANPIIKLKDMAVAVGHGKLDTRVDISSKDEIGVLAAAFNQMLDDLNSTTVSKIYVDNIIKSMFNSLLVVDSEKNIKKVNQATLQLLGYEKNELVGQSIEAVIKAEDSQTIHKDDLIGASEKIYLTKAGREIPILFSGSPFTDDSGKIEGIVCVAQDISKRKAYEQQLITAFDRLQKANNRMQDELALAKDIQYSLLPPANPDWSDLEVICYTSPASHVGGDFYAYYAFAPFLSPETERKRYALAVGDVSGKGVSAALLMATSLSQFDASVALNFTPEERLIYLDKAIETYTKPRGQNCAMCYVEIIMPVSTMAGKDKKWGLRVVNAGCIPPYLKQTNGVVEELDVRGFALGQGLGTQLGYQEVRLNLSKGDLVILTSDGVVEAKNDTDELFGFERLRRTIETGPTISAEAMLNHVKTELLAFANGAEQHDDLTIVVLRM